MDERLGPALHHRAGRFVPLGDDAGEGGRDAGVLGHGGNPRTGGLTHMDLLFNRGEGGAGRRELGGGFGESGGHVVEFLLRDEVRPLLGDRGEAIVGELANL